MKQATIKTPFSLIGKGLHTGMLIHAQFMPAGVNEGITLCRVDLPEQPCYQALAQYVSATERGTVLQNGDWKISTVEHALSALYAMGITNCRIELNAPEMPILDGSATPFVRAIEQSGIAEQEADAKEWTPAEVIEYTAESGSSYRIEPANGSQYHVEISFPGNVLHNQTAVLDRLTDYPKEIAAARTFCFVREIAYLLSKGLIQGGDLENALVIYEQPIPQEAMDRLTDSLGAPRQDATKMGYLQPLHYENEPSRHKLLDLVGDLSLMGVRINAKIYATKPGHGGNTELAKELCKLIK